MSKKTDTDTTDGEIAERVLYDLHHLELARIVNRLISTVAQMAIEREALRIEIVGLKSRLENTTSTHPERVAVAIGKALDNLVLDKGQ